MSLAHRQASHVLGNRSAGCVALPKHIIRKPSHSAKQQGVACEASSSAMATGQQTTTWITPEARKTMFITEAKDIVEPVPGVVRGTIPTWLNGDLIGNGSGNYTAAKHMFDGFAMLTKISFRNGTASASQRFVEGQQYQYYKKTGKLKWRELVTDATYDNDVDKALKIADNMLALAFNAPATTDNASVSVLPLPDGTMLAASEPIRAFYKVSRDLETLSQVDLAKDGIKGQVTTAHPKMMKDGRTYVNVTHSLPGGGTHVVLWDTHTLKRKEIAFIRDTRPFNPAWIHDLAITDKYAVILETPLTFNMVNLIFGGEAAYATMDWCPEEGSKVHVVALDGSGMVTHTAPAFFNMHVANAWEEGDNIQIQFAGYKDPTILKDLMLKNCTAYPGSQVSESYLVGFTIPQSTKQSLKLPYPHKVVSHPDLTFCEFPAINSLYSTKPHRYTYCLAAKRPTHLGNATAKIDALTGEVKMWHEPGGSPGEPMFVPAPDAKTEDDGVVLVTTMGPDGKTFVAVLDGQSFTELGRVSFSHAMPYRFHATYIPA